MALNADWALPARPFFAETWIKNASCVAAIAVTLGLVGHLWSEHVSRITMEDAYVASSSGDNESALRGYSQAITRAPNDYMAYFRRAVALMRTNHFDEALTDLDQAVRLSPQPPTVAALGTHAWDMTRLDTRTLALVVEVREVRASLLLRLNQPDAAMADLDAAIAMDSRKSELIWRRGTVRIALHRYDDAIADFNTIIARKPEWRWFLGRGVAELLNDNLQQAVTDLARAAEMAPSNALVAQWLMQARLELAQST